MLLLSDGNLPTGSFVASSGLEAYVKHGFFGIPQNNSTPSRTSLLTSSPSPPSLTRSTINFIRDSLQTYAHCSLPFISAVHDVCRPVKDESATGAADNALRSLKELDDLYESMTLNHVARRASKAQGVALLTLLSRGMIRPSWLQDPPGGSPDKSILLEKLADDLKLEIRKGEVYGHLPICWGILTATLGLSCERSRHLHIFLHARSLVSASIRMNTLGPYAAQQLLLHVVRPLIDNVVMDCSKSQICLVRRSPSTNVLEDPTVDDEEENGPATTWPLGEILGARHDLQHSRIFNS